MAIKWNGAKEKEHEKIEPEEFPGVTLGGKFGNTIIRLAKKIFGSLTDWFEERLINFVIGVLVKIETSGKTVFGSLIKELKDKEAIPDFLKPIFDEIEDPKHEIAALLGQSASGSAIGGLFGAIFDPIMASTKYKLNTLLKPYRITVDQAVLGNLFGVIGDKELDETIKAQGYRSELAGLFTLLYKNKIPFAELLELLHRGKITEVLFEEKLKLLGFEELDITMLKNLIYKIPSISESIGAYFRGKITEEDLRDIAEKNGIDEEFLNIIITASRQLLGIADIRSIYFREGKDESWLNGQLDKLGFSEEAREDLKKIMPFYPGVGDLVRFAVREVYYPDYVEKYGLADEYPPEYEEAAKKAGLPPEQAENYWKAHWVLPSILQGYEMLHRGVIGSEELGDLFKAVDIMPYWRERLEKISYRVFTRVDVRRMYRDGVLDEAGVLKAYMDLGYDAEKAEKMTEFTIAFYTADEKDLARADVLDGYKREYFTEGEALDLLKLLGYTAEQAEYFTSKVDYKKEIEAKKKFLSLTEDEYKKGVKTENEAISALTEQGFKATEIDYHLRSWNIDKLAKPETPSKADLKSWLAKKVITRDVFITEMRNTGFADRYINYYLAELKQKEI